MQSLGPTQPIILASQSPRRKYLLEQAGLNIRVRPSRVDESAIAIKSLMDHPRELAQTKARDVARHFPNHWIIGADTVVLINGAMLGKPVDMDQARHMLARLSGQTHRVVTGYCILAPAHNIDISDQVITDVTFKQLSAREIDWYVHTGEPFDKAGAYAVQGIGTFLVKRINGSYTNVIGLPVCEIVAHLLKHDVIGFKTTTD